MRRDAAEILAKLDMTAWIGVLGLLDECPVLSAALRAVPTSFADDAVVVDVNRELRNGAWISSYNGPAVTSFRE